MKIASRYGSFDELVGGLREQKEGDILLHESLRYKPCDRPHYLSLVFRPKIDVSGAITDLREMTKQWDPNTFKLQVDNTHLTVGSFGRIAENQGIAYYLASACNPLKDELKKAVSEIGPIVIEYAEATIGQTGINLEVDIDDNTDNRMGRLKAIPGLTIQPSIRWSISLLRYTKVDAMKSHLKMRLLELNEEGKGITFNNNETIDELALVVLDKTGESFIEMGVYKLGGR